MKKRIFIILVILNAILLAGCSNKSNEIKENTPPKVEENPIVEMTIKDYGAIKIELYPNIAYNTVANFVTLIEDGFYDNNTIHRVQKDFVIQGGDPTAKGNGGPGYSIKGEFAQNGFENNLSHTTGIISMARTGEPDSAGSQFFIVLDDNAKYSLDGMYAGFGKVIEGMDILEKIEKKKFKYLDEEMGMLKNPLTIEKTTVDTKGHTYKVTKIENKKAN